MNDSNRDTELLIGRCATGTFMDYHYVADVHPCDRHCPCVLHSIPIESVTSHGHFDLCEVLDVSEIYLFPLQSMEALRFLFEVRIKAAHPSVSWWKASIYQDVLDRFGEFRHATYPLVESATAAECRIMNDFVRTLQFTHPYQEIIRLGR